MALITVDLEAISPDELRRRLGAAGYNLAQIDDLSKTLRVDLVPILAGWAPVLVEMMAPRHRRTPWWRRVWRWMRNR